MSDTTLAAPKAREKLYERVRRDAPFDRKAEDALELGRRYLGVENGHLTRIDRETDHWEAIASTDPDGGRFHAGLELDLDETYCRRTVEADDQVALHDAPEQGWVDDPAYEAHELRCYQGTTLVLDGDPYGTVCFVSSNVREEFDDDELLFAELVARLLERELERERHEAELERQTALATVLNRVLRHNLRNDMGVIRGRTRLMAEELEDDSAGEVVLDHVDGLLELSEKARELDRVVSAEFEYESVDVPTLVEGVAESVAEDYPAASVSVDADGRATTDLLPSFERAVEELVENAVKHGGEEPTVAITAETVPNAVEIRIADDGPGLPDQEVEVLNAGTESPLLHGSGLGLWLVRWIASGHGGSVEATDTDDGTMMRVSVPRTPRLTGVDR
ncbi:GAF domain-containing sensor histidine kinase [Halobaculum sp. CBA1158]|uniref:GAF domain-containing sensor histidine kinase n=1 Tax=Halobaculum sp. CBA1158 TaxID=2904243 RepID=UPI001F266D68|nr:GAF domain-containing sensor histidine kinase [Halobaculum sp. CBA1158]UIP00572.1 GAF domain-containing sensor histidine kinase [Halobaculum sp. CBA1158]